MLFTKKGEREREREREGENKKIEKAACPREHSVEIHEYSLSVNN
jgi:hypothetical protein